MSVISFEFLFKMLCYSEWASRIWGTGSFVCCNMGGIGQRVDWKDLGKTEDGIRIGSI